MFKKIIFVFGLFILVFCPFFARGQEPQVEAAYTVSALVPSEVIKDKSEVYLNPKETLADPASHKMFLKVTLKDKDSKSLKNLDVWLSTNRGAVDLIEILSGPDVNSQETGPNGQGKKGRTDANGEISFSISSWTPGEAILYIKADSLIDFDAQNIRFDPLPFPANLTVTVPLPGTQKKITLISPQSENPQAPLTPEQEKAKKLVNTGTEIKIPFWIFGLIIFWIIITPLFIILAALSLRRIRKTERREMALLEKIAQAEHIDDLRKNLKGG